MRFKSLVLQFLLISIISVPVWSQSSNDLSLSSRKFFSTAFFEPTDLNHKSKLYPLNKPEKLYLPDGMERAETRRLYLPFSENLAESITKEKVPNKVFEDLFVKSGKWTFDQVLDLARLNMTDADYLQFKSSSAGIRAGAARKFYKEVLNSQYILSYTLDDLRTAAENYDRASAKNVKKGGKAIPAAERKNVGYMANVTIGVYKVVMDDEILNTFETHIFGDTIEHNEKQMIDALQSFPFKIKKVGTRRVATSSTYDKTSKNRKKPSMTKLLESLVSNANLDHEIDELFDGTKEFDILTVLYASKPGLEIKIGTKEGLKRNDRFFVYELVQNRKGKIVEKRKGAIRAKGKPSNNKGISSGQTKPTSFYQIQGRKLEKGMIVKEKRNIVNFDLAYGTNLYLGTSWMLRFMDASRIAFDFQSFYDDSKPDSSLWAYDLSLVLEKDFHFGRSFYAGLEGGFFIEDYSFVSDSLQNHYMPEPENEDESGVVSQVLNYTVGASLGYYINPQIKLFGRIRYMPGEFNEGSPLRQDGILPVDRIDLRYFGGISFEF